ncbi:MAG: hypothetical protein KUG58_10100, partial [Marinosulfonomonas sp.]|nr:hypothetical protein [Marinosulfonomonas sp.]
MSDVDIEHLATWIGKKESHSEVISPGLIERFRATFDAYLWQQDADIAPLGLHWCLAPPAVVDGELGPDGSHVGTHAPQRLTAGEHAPRLGEEGDPQQGA